MSKPWFLKMALEAEPSPLSQRISSILSQQQSSSTVSADVDKIAGGIATEMKLDNRSGSADEPSRCRT